MYAEIYIFSLLFIALKFTVTKFKYVQRCMYSFPIYGYKTAKTIYFLNLQLHIQVYVASNAHLRHAPVFFVPTVHSSKIYVVTVHRAYFFVVLSLIVVSATYSLQLS